MNDRKPKSERITPCTESLVDFKGLAKILSTKESLLRDNHAKWQLPHIKIGPRQIRFRPSDVIAFFEELTEQLDSDSPEGESHD